MSLEKDYFLLYHGINDIEQTSTYGTNENKDKDEFFDIASLVLSATRRDYEKFITLDSFKKLVSKITNKEVRNLDELYQLQFCLIDAIENDSKNCNIERMHESFEYLKNENVIGQFEYNKLISLFDPKELASCDDEIDVEDELKVDEKKPFKEAKNELDDLILELKSIFITDDFKKELEETSNYLSNQKFSIGITGVMNAGKSTMLNALMGQEILGSAVVPETANLTIVKHGKQSAKVFYWNKDEWQKIEQSANEIKSIKDFVDETKKVFGDKLTDLIKEKSLSEEVNINSLASYTSAEASGKKCNLVKYVELKSDLNFLSEGIEIVDTPGLDDPVIQREEITKEYISDCDLMIHLMNVSQSATLKDVEFIIDALLYQNITKLLIVITRADTVTKEQIEEVINYTKSSIQRQLNAQNKDNKLNYILEHIKFIPISGKMALYHRTGRSEEAIKNGFNLEDTGILEIEDYLNETLFGADSSKSDLIIKSAISQLQKIITKELKSFNYELVLLSKSKDELLKDLEDFTKKKDTNKRIFASLKEDINLYKSDVTNYLETLEAFLSSELIELQNIIKQRVFNDVKYSLEKDKRKPENSRIKTIVETAIKDGIIDIIRDYRYKFIKKSQSIGEICEQKYQDLGFVMGHKNDNFDARGFFQDDFKSGFLTSSNELLINKILKEVKDTKQSKLLEFDRAIDAQIKGEFSSIEKTIKEKAKKISEMLIENFFKAIAEPLNVFEHKLKKDEKLLQDRIENFEEKEKNKEVVTMDIHKKIKRLESVMKGLKA
ncbi:dynamin family protein [Halarcobacter anaerophilus]|uniref:dynamin family protein n=1 Tax=Halarcobacter anaerophilus TaxID=877500 RepID=UPI0005C9A5BE|nr:dynamin family protein [Halarcobacter anaerophilus]